MTWSMYKFLTVVILCGVAVVIALAVAQRQPVIPEAAPPVDYIPAINPADFTADITNPYFSLPVGKKLVYEAQTDEGRERIEILVPGWIRNVAGVQTLVFWDRVYLDGELIEDTRDYVAQHRGTGDVWYFGEHVDNYEDGVLKDHEGAWLAGVDGAQPGIWFSGNPRPGLEYRQEYYAGVAEDAARVESESETVNVPAGTFTDCVKVFEFSPLFTATAHKYHCREVGGTALEVDLPDLPTRPEEVRTELIEVDLDDAVGVEVPVAYQQECVLADSSR